MTDKAYVRKGSKSETTVTLFNKRKLMSVPLSQAFDRSIGKDEHLAVAFFQRGITFLKKEKYVWIFALFGHF